jgi:hypothetical protein
MTQSNSNTQTSQQSTTAPGPMTSGTVQSIINQLNPLITQSGITPTQTSAINQLTQNAEAGNPYASGVGATASSLLNGGGATSQNPTLESNLTNYDNSIGSIAGAAPGSSTVNSPDVQRALQAANVGITNQVDGEFAAAGRSGSGANQGTLAYNEANADAPIILNQANTDAANQVATANNLYNAGNTTSGAVTGNNQTALGNEEAGITAAPQALTAANYGPTAAIEAQELGQEIPAQNLGMLANIGIPLAQLNTTTTGTGTSNTTNTPSFLQDITGLGGLIGSTGTGATSVGGAALSGGTAGSGLLGLLGAL